MLGGVVSTEAILPRTGLSDPYWLTYDSDINLLTFGSGSTPGTNELLRKEIPDASDAIRYFSFTNSEAGAIYANPRSTAINKTGADFHKANPGTGLATAADWKLKWQFNDTVNTARFDLKGESGAAIVLGPSASSPANTFRIRLSNKFAAEIIEGENDRAGKEVAESIAASVLPNDGQFHPFWIRRDTASATIALGTWSAGTTEKEGEIGDVTLVE